MFAKHSTKEIIFRKAKINDAPKIKELIEPYAEKGIMLSRPIYEIYENIRDFSVAIAKGKIIGCCSLHIFGKEYSPYNFNNNKELILAEIRALVVASNWQGEKIGTQLVKNCIKEGRILGTTKIFTLTLKNNIDFFKKFGFKKVKKTKLPQKIWQECIKCPRFPSECNEIALFFEF